MAVSTGAAILSSVLGSLGGAALNNRATGKAIDAQTANSNRALGLQRDALRASILQAYPIYQSQLSALNSLRGMEGMSQVEIPTQASILAMLPEPSRGGGKGGSEGSLFRQLTIDPLDVLPDSAERVIGDPLGIF